MQVINLPDSFQVGNVRVENVSGPIETQRTTILQEAGFEPSFIKWMEHPKVGAGRPITVYSLDVILPDDIMSATDAWRSEALAVAGFLAMFLDERLAQEELFEDVSVLDPNGTVLARLDVVPLVRTFEPTHPWLPEFEEELVRFEASQATPGLRAACRWYLRAVMAGPTADGFVLLWVAVEALLPAPGGARSRNEVRAVEAALQRADPKLDPKAIDPTVGRMAGLRAQIVHQGVESNPTIKNAFYTLESLVRLLLRFKFSVAGGWPYFPSQPMLVEELLASPRKPRTTWCNPPANE